MFYSKDLCDLNTLVTGPFYLSTNLKLSKSDMASCMLVQRLGADTIKTAVVPMWIFYQFLVSVVLLRILIVMMTITYRKIYDNLDTQWK